MVFLAGVGRSGTTLVERTLAEADGVTALGEVIHLWERGVLRDERCACGEPFSGCPFWTKVGDLAFGGWERGRALRMVKLRARVGPTSRVPLLRAGVPEDLVRDAIEYADAFTRVYAAAADVSGDVLLDSSKRVSLAWILHRADTVDLSLLHTVRDPRGVATSWLRQTVRPEAVDDSDRLMPTHRPARLAMLWDVHNLIIESLGRRVPSARLRYEDFVADPVGRTGALLSGAGIADDPRRWVSPTSIRLGTSHSVAGNPMRFRLGDLAVRPDERWREELPPAARRTVTLLTSPLLRRYGYHR
ncbi:MAG: hypothetical protein JWO46_1162 [Nocardioidaceae bacterium]|nr:hypothetical protein [Nocardioidaceae bacterium]